MISKLDQDKEYSEKEINEILDKWHHFGDSAILRRSLYDQGLLNTTTDCKSYLVLKDGDNVNSYTIS